MDPILIVSGLLAVLGGGAGAVAWYRKNYGAPSSSTSTPTSSTVGPEGGSAAEGTNSTFENYDSVLASTGGGVGGELVSHLVTPPIAATPAPIPNPGRATVVGYTPPAPTKGANTPPAAIQPVISGLFSGLEAHI